MRSIRRLERPSLVLRFVALLAAPLALAGCLSSTPMARSATAEPSRRLYADETEADVFIPNAEEETGPTEAEETVLAEEAPAVPATPSGGEAAGVVFGGVDVTTAPTPERVATSSVDEAYPLTEGLSTSASTTTSGGYVPPPNLGSTVAVEPLPWVPLDPAPVPAGPRRVLLATMEVPPGRTIFPPVSACQDVLVYVQEGTLEAMGTGVGSTDAPATLYAGDAVRFGPEGDGRLTNRSGLPARALVVIARAATAGAPLYTAPVDAGLCELVVNPDPIVRPSRLASTATTAPLSVMDGHLSVRILLDLDGTAAAHAGLAVLEGDETMHVDAHAHDEADEVLYVEEGEGVMTVGEQHIDVAAGSVLYIPHGMTHAFEPSGRSSFVAVQLYAPSGPEQRFRGLSAP